MTGNSPTDRGFAQSGLQPRPPRRHELRNTSMKISEVISRLGTKNQNRPSGRVARPESSMGMVTQQPKTRTTPFTTQSFRACHPAVVEPGGRRSSHRPRPPHRPNAPGHGLSVGGQGHDRRTNPEAPRCQTRSRRRHPRRHRPGRQTIDPRTDRPHQARRETDVATC